MGGNHGRCSENVWIPTCTAVEINFCEVSPCIKKHGGGEPKSNKASQNGAEAGLGVYVDDFELMATEADTPKLWAELEKRIEFKEPYKVWGSEPTAHLGCDYEVRHSKETDGGKIIAIRANMAAYHLDIVRRFENILGVNVKEQRATPCLDAS